MKGVTFGGPEGLKDGLVAKSVLATLHDKSQPVVDALMGLLLQQKFNLLTPFPIYPPKQEKGIGYTHTHTYTHIDRERERESLRSSWRQPWWQAAEAEERERGRHLPAAALSKDLMQICGEGLITGTLLGFLKWGERLLIASPSSP